MAGTALDYLNAGPNDDRTQRERFHDALQLAWRWFQFCVMLDV